jgi:hypothetical protein
MEKAEKKEDEWEKKKRREGSGAWDFEMDWI